MIVQILAAALAAASPQTFAQEVAASKKSIMESADETFVEMWSNASRTQELESAGITAAQARKFSLWAQLGVTLGSCRQHSKPADMADWLASFDQIPTPSGEYGDAFRLSARKAGMKTYDEMQPTYLGELGLTFEEQKKLCASDLEAVRQIIKGM